MIMPAMIDHRLVMRSIRACVRKGHDRAMTKAHDAEYSGEQDTEERHGGPF
jgi:hypothetical protein